MSGATRGGGIGIAYQDLQEFIRILEGKGMLKRIKVEVDPVLEITEITDRISKKLGPALLFEKVKGSKFPLLINAFGSLERMKLALEREDLSQIGQEVVSLLQQDFPVSFWGKLKTIPQLGKLTSFLPKKVKTGPCKEIIEKDNPSLENLPILKCWPEDGGRYLTLPLVFTKDPETGRRNVGMYRMQVYDEKTLGVHWHLQKDGAEHYRKYESRGEKMPVAVVLGADPATIYASTAPLPMGLDELMLAGFLRKAPVELVPCETIDLEVPAFAEFVLEGYVYPGETRLEGPFGDHTGYYSLQAQYPVFHLQCLTHRKKAVYPTTIVGRPPMEDCYLGKATERIFLPLLQLQLPELVDINFPLEGVFNNCVLVSIKKKYPGHGRKIINAFWGLGQLMFTKVVIVVDDYVDVQDISEVAWRVFNNLEPSRGVIIQDGPVDILVHSSPQVGYGSKLGIDATIPWPEEGQTREWPREIKMDQEIKKKVKEKWSSYGLD